jgi:hypothetical protein
MNSALPCVKPPVWKFTITFDEKNPYRLSANTIYAKSALDVEDFGRISGFEVIAKTDLHYGKMRWLRIAEPEDSPKLKLLLQALEDRYDIKPSNWFIVPPEFSEQYFGVRKEREFTEEQIKSAEYLRLISTKFHIGTNSQRPTPDDETYYVHNDGAQRTKVDFGFLSPFPAIGISEELKGRIVNYKLDALRIEPIVVRRKDNKPARKPLWKMSGDVTLPRTLCRYIDGNGKIKEPYDDWSYKFECAYFDDWGHLPAVLSYRRKDIEQCQPFDIAMTAEKEGNGPYISFRYTIVSQRFRSVLTDLKVKGVGYVPVVLQ